MEILSLDYEQLSRAAEVYAEVFAGPPWNENTICPKSIRFFGLETNSGQKCPEFECDGILEEAYPASTTQKYIGKEISKPGSVAKIIVTEGKLAGFAWGYKIDDPRVFSEEKYKTNQMKTLVQQVLSQAGVSENFFYISEVGIKSEFRNRGYSNLLTAELVEAAELSQLPVVMRTNRDSPMVVVAQRFGMDQILGPTVTVSNRQIIVSCNDTDRLDLENNSRVLFIRPK